MPGRGRGCVDSEVALSALCVGAARLAWGRTRTAAVPRGGPRLEAFLAPCVDRLFVCGGARVAIQTRARGTSPDVFVWSEVGSTQGPQKTCPCSQNPSAQWGSWVRTGAGRDEA